MTFAVRDTNIDGVEIAKDDYMGIADGKIVVSHKELMHVIETLLSHIISEEDEIVTILSGEDATDEQTAHVVQWIEKQFPDVEVETHHGGQPLYPFIFAIE